MKKLIQDPAAFYTPAKRPSGHDIANTFGKDNGGAIPSNLLQIPNSESNGQYLSACKLTGAQQHPARFPSKLPEFFIRFLTDPGAPAAAAARAKRVGRERAVRRSMGIAR
jgi:site-specific DNA-methyltransferase (cytosine-N4-specific)